MGKNDYKEMKKKYDKVCYLENEYRRNLVEYINDAFEKHGEFEFKCNTHESWQKADEVGEFDAMEDLPVYVNIGVDDDGIHEVYPYRIRENKTDYAYKYIEVDGYDRNDQCFVERWDAYSDIETLSSIALFIDSVLGQEMKHEPRTFEKNEEVVVCMDGDQCFPAIVEIEQTAESMEDLVGVYPIGEDGKCSLPRMSVESWRIYRKAEGKVCPKCGGPLYNEHNEDIDYPFFCPECQENFYNIEVQ